MQLLSNLFDLDRTLYTWWSRRDVLKAYTAYKQVRHPIVGPLSLQPKAYRVVDRPDLHMVIYMPVEETDPPDKLVLLSKPRL